MMWVQLEKKLQQTGIHRIGAGFQKKETYLGMDAPTPTVRQEVRVTTKVE